jgi:hypothetical protein
MIETGTRQQLLVARKDECSSLRKEIDFRLKAIDT